jgi:hypothetical protein
LPKILRCGNFSQKYDKFHKGMRLSFWGQLVDIELSNRPDLYGKNSYNDA